MDGAVQKILGCFLSGNRIQGTAFLKETDKPQEHLLSRSRYSKHCLRTYIQTSPISFSACNKGNRRRLHAGNSKHC